MRCLGARPVIRSIIAKRVAAARALPGRVVGALAPGRRRLSRAPTMPEHYARHQLAARDAVAKLLC